MIVDYHMHLRGPAVRPGEEPLVHDAATIETYLERARAAGIDEIGFSEHVYYFRQTADIWELEYQRERCLHDLDAYAEAVLEARRRGLPVKLGLEVDYVGAKQARLAEILAPYPWDYLLGSVHWIDGLAVDQRPGLWAELPVEGVWRRYWAAVAELAASGAVDVLAHPDLVKIWDLRPDGAVRDELQEHAAQAIAAAGAAVEISTAGLRKHVGELYPDVGFLRACAELGVPVTLASDAHQPEIVGHELPRAIELAHAAGIDTVAVFDGRRRHLEPLG